MTSLILFLHFANKKPHKDFELIRSRINNIFGIDNAADEVIIFVNTCKMQIHLAHFGDVQLKTQAKKINAIEIEKLTGIKNYKAKEEQRKQMSFVIRLSKKTIYSLCLSVPEFARHLHVQLRQSR